MKIFGDIDLNQGQLKQSLFEMVTEFPSSPERGQVVFLNKRVYVCTEVTGGSFGTPTWIPLTNEIDFFVHEQTEAASVWEIRNTYTNTNFTAQVFDMNGLMIIPDEIDSSTIGVIKISFGQDFVGKAVIIHETGAVGDTGGDNGAGSTIIFDEDGKLLPSLLPSISISETSVVNSQNAMLAVPAQIGDIAVRTDLSKTFILAASDPTQLSSWQELLTPAGGVSSVNGQTGTVVISNATTSADGLMSSADKSKLNGIAANANNYSLPTASTSTLGGVKVDGSTITISNGVISSASAYSLPTASASTLGGIKVGSGLTINGSGVLSAVGAVSTVAGRTGDVTLSTSDISGLSAVAVSGNYADLQGAPTVDSDTYKGTWNATTNTPSLTSGVGTKGQYYKVSVAGNTVLDGITSWNVDDILFFNGTAWTKSTFVTTFNGRTGDISLTDSDISTALGFTPYDALNPSGYQTAAQVTASISSAAYILPGASTSTLGGVKVGSTLSISNDVLDYNLPTASTSALGGVKVGTTLSISSGVLNYNLPKATTSILGGIKVDGTSITVDSNGVISATAAGYGALTYSGVWNASTNTPTIASGGAGVTKGTYYKVSVAGSTSIDGISQWNVGDIIAYNGTTWDKIDGVSSEVTSVFGRTGAVTLQSSDVTSALGFTPYNSTNPNGYQTAAQVTATISSNAYTLPTASTSVLGGVKVDGTTITISNGVISSSGSNPTSTASITTWTGLPCDQAFSVFGAPSNSEVVCRVRAGRAYTIPANFSGSIAVAGVAATASTVFSVQKNGTQVATITFAPSGTVGTFSTQAAINFAIGDKLTVVNQSTADATLADIDFTILGSLA